MLCTTPRDGCGYIHAAKHRRPMLAGWRRRRQSRAAGERSRTSSFGLTASSHLLPSTQPSLPFSACVGFPGGRIVALVLPLAMHRGFGHGVADPDVDAGSRRLSHCPHGTTVQVRIPFEADHSGLASSVDGRIPMARWPQFLISLNTTTRGLSLGPLS